MTIGSIIRDNRYSVTTSCGVDNQAGIIYSKNWSGSDDPINHAKENAYVMSRTSEVNPQCQYRVKGSGQPFSSGTYESCGFGIVPPFSFAVFDSNDQIGLINRLGTAIRQHNFHAGVMLGEARESISMVVDRTTRIRKAISALRRGNLSAVAKHLGVQPKAAPKKGGTINQSWLEFYYGWRPLVNDIYEGSQAIYSLTNKPLSRVYKARLKKQVDLTETPDSSLITGKAVTTRHLRCYMEEDFSPWASLGLDDPASVIWERVPYSFVFDWVIPVGHYLTARALVNNLKQAVIWQTEFRSLQKERLNFSALPYWEYEILGPGRSSSLVSLSRQQVTLSVPRPGVKSFGQIATFGHLRDAISLFISAKHLDQRGG